MIVNSTPEMSVDEVSDVAQARAELFYPQDEERQAAIAQASSVASTIFKAAGLVLLGSLAWNFVRVRT